MSHLKHGHSAFAVSVFSFLQSSNVRRGSVQCDPVATRAIGFGSLMLRDQSSIFRHVLCDD